MKKFSKLLTVLIMVFLCSLSAFAFGCDGFIDVDQVEHDKKEWVTVIFADEDGTILLSCEVEKGTIPVYEGEIPTKEGGEGYYYEFTGWKGLEAVQENTVFIATFEKVAVKYLVKFVNEDGTVLQESEVKHGDMPVYEGATPEKAATAQYTYTFAGWDSEIVAASGVATYTATYSSVVNKYLVKFVNEDGSSLQEGEVAYGEVPVYAGETPSKAATAEHSFTFAGWDSEIVAVSGAVIYTATFTSVVNKYLVKFVNEDGSSLQESEVDYGVVPVYAGETPSKAATAEHSFTFAGWDSEIVAVSGAVTYTATFTSVVNKYLVKFVNEDGSSLQESEVEYGVVPAYEGATPEKAATAQYTYTFAGWDSEIVAVSGAVTYTATYSSVVNKYLVKFVNEDGSSLQESEVDYGVVPAYEGATPEKAATAQHTYTFAGWDSEIVAVSGAVTYTATYSSVVNKYLVKFVNADGEVLQESEIEYGATPAYEGTPALADDEKYSYIFAGWDSELLAVTGEAVYTAVYEKAPLLDGAIDAEFYGDTYMQYTMQWGKWNNRGTADIFVYTYENDGSLYMTYDVTGASVIGASGKLTGSGVVLMVKNAQSGEGKYMRAYANGCIRSMPLANVIANNNGYTGATNWQDPANKPCPWYGYSYVGNTTYSSQYTLEFRFDFADFGVESASELSFALGWISNDGWECGYANDNSLYYVNRVSDSDSTSNYATSATAEKSWWTYDSIVAKKAETKAIRLDGVVDAKYEKSIVYSAANSENADDVTTTRLHWYDDAQGKAVFFAFEVTCTSPKTINNKTWENTPGNAGVVFAISNGTSGIWGRAYATNLSYKTTNSSLANFYSCTNKFVDWVRGNQGVIAAKDKNTRVDAVTSYVIEIRVDYADLSISSGSELSIMLGGIHDVKADGKTNDWELWHYNRVTGESYEFATGNSTAAGHVANVSSDYYWTLAQLEAEMQKQNNG